MKLIKTALNREILKKKMYIFDKKLNLFFLIQKILIQNQFLNTISP